MDSKLSRWCDSLIEAGWLAAVVVTPLFFNIHSERVFEPDKLTLLRSIALLMVAAWVVKFVDQRGWQRLNWLRWRDEDSVWRMPFVLPVFLLVIVYLVSTLFSVTPRVSWAGSYQRLQGTYTTLSYIVIFVLMIATMRTRAQVRRVITAVIITSIPISFYALLQHFDLDPLPWGGNVQRRVAGHMGNAIFIAAYLIMAVPLTLARIIDAFTSILSDEDLAYADVIRSSIYIFTVAIQLIAIYWSQSRGPWLGLATGLFAFVLIVLVSLRNAAAEKDRFRLVEALKALAMVVLGTAVLYFLISLALNAITETGRAQSLAGPMSSFVAFAAAVGVLVVVFFVMIAARRGWRWLWLSWIVLALTLAGWLAAFNFAKELALQFEETPVVSNVAETLVSWQDLPAIGRLGRLLEADEGTGKVRVLIWEGALELLEPHEPLQFPNGEEDRFNVLRPLIGYGPESMYVAYNRFYPPELATVEARNASPDRSHNETFDALVITGGLGFLVWQALYLAVFYYGFSWLGVVDSRRDRNLLIGFWIGGAVVGTAVIVPLLGLPFLGVAIPFGSIAGLVLYLIYYALFTRSEMGEENEADPFQTDRLLMTALVAAVLAHYVEIHFGIAIAATRLHFFVYLGLMFVVGYLLPRLKEMTAEVPALQVPRRRSPRRRSQSQPDGSWVPVLLSALMLILIVGILGFEFMTYSKPPDKTIETMADLTTAEIFHQSLFVNARKGFADSPFIFLMIVLTWVLGVLVSVSEMVKGEEFTFSVDPGTLIQSRRHMAAAVLGVLGVGSLIIRFLGPAPANASAGWLLGRNLLLLWAGLCLWATIRLVADMDAARLGAGIVAMTGLVFALPVLVAGGTLFGLVTAVACLAILYLLWDKSWNDSLMPAGVLAMVSLVGGLLYAYLQASVLRASLFFQASAPLETAEQIRQFRVAEAEQATSYLTLFYLFVIFLIFVTAFVLARPLMARVRSFGTTPAFLALFVLFILSFVAISRTNMRIIQADMVYKRGKPFDQQAVRSRDVQAWDIAIAIYERAIELAPLEDFYYLFLGRAYLERSTLTTDPAEQAALLNEAQDRLLRAQEINPLNTDHTANLARLNTRWVQFASEQAEKQEHLQQAEQFYQDALSLSPQNSVIRNEYARLAFDLKQDCGQSIDLFDRSINIDPYYSVTYFARADVYVNCAADKSESIKADFYKKAVDSIEEGIEIDGGNVRTWLQAGQIYQELDEYDKALSAYHEARARNTNEQIAAWNFDYLLATLYREMGEEEMAQNFGRQALATAPADVAPQIQSFLNQASPGQVITQVVTQTQSAVPAAERPLAQIEPPARNQYYDDYPPFVIDTANTYEAVIRTEKGEMRFRLFDDRVPLTVNNFVFLAQQGFYDGTTFHRVLEDFMAQAGDPTGTGTGGPGYTFADEIDNELSFNRRGLLGMANNGPNTNTNGSQFFITFGPAPWLNDRHTIFGELVAGDAVLDSLTLRDPTTNPDYAGDVIERIDIVEVGQ